MYAHLVYYCPKNILDIKSHNLPKHMVFQPVNQHLDLFYHKYNTPRKAIRGPQYHHRLYHLFRLGANKLPQSHQHSHRYFYHTLL